MDTNKAQPNTPYIPWMTSKNYTNVTSSFCHQTTFNSQHSHNQTRAIVKSGKKSHNLGTFDNTKLPTKNKTLSNHNRILRAYDIQ